MSTTFKKTIENFVCEKCLTEVNGTGYTNHCPHCLWSKHVDIHPGDRAEECQGMMKPVRIIIDGGELSIVHQCVECGHEKKNKRSPDDDFEQILDVMKEQQPL